MDRRGRAWGQTIHVLMCSTAAESEAGTHHLLCGWHTHWRADSVPHRQTQQSTQACTKGLTLVEGHPQEYARGQKHQSIVTQGLKECDRSTRGSHRSSRRDHKENNHVMATDYSKLWPKKAAFIWPFWWDKNNTNPPQTTDPTLVCFLFFSWSSNRWLTATFLAEIFLHFLQPAI